MKVTDEMVNRFLSWRLPKDFAPDCGISFKPINHPDALTHLWPVGTNLLTADQARQMLEYVLATAKDERADSTAQPDEKTDGEKYTASKKPCPFCAPPDPNFRYDPQGEWKSD